MMHTAISVHGMVCLALPAIMLWVFPSMRAMSNSPYRGERSFILVALHERHAHAFKTILGIKSSRLHFLGVSNISLNQLNCTCN